MLDSKLCGLVFEVGEAFQEDRDTGRNLDTLLLRKKCRPAEYGRSVKCTSQKDRIVNPLESELLKFENRCLLYNRASSSGELRELRLC